MSLVSVGNSGIIAGCRDRAVQDNQSEGAPRYRAATSYGDV